MATMSLQGTLTSFQERLLPIEKLFFSWLMRVFAAGTLVGCAWIDDAPPLELGAAIITIYVGIRIVSDFGNFAAAAPFNNRFLQGFTASLAVVLLVLAFMSIVTFVDRIAVAVA